jgi:hypothetical protein
VLSGRGLCDELNIHAEESYRLWCVVMCDLETWRMRKPWPMTCVESQGHRKKKVGWFIGTEFCVIPSKATGLTEKGYPTKNIWVSFSLPSFCLNSLVRDVSCTYTWTNQYLHLLGRISNALKKAFLYQNIRFQLILFNAISKTRYTKEFKNNRVTSGLMLNYTNGLEISPHNEHMYIIWVTTQPQEETLIISYCCKIRLKTACLMQHGQM